MSLREFKDEEGREWRAWDVRQENIHPATRAEDYMQDYLEGWIAFESKDGEAKCRLHPIPPRWEEAQPSQLVTWLRKAEAVRGDRTSGAHGRTAAEVVAKLAAGSERPRGTSRTFRFPAGRFWSVAEWTTTTGTTISQPREHAVLRFTSGLRSLDLTEWPSDWQSLPDEQLATLLARGFPRPPQQRNPTGFQRRASDHSTR